MAFSVDPERRNDARKSRSGSPSGANGGFPRFSGDPEQWNDGTGSIDVDSKGYAQSRTNQPPWWTLVDDVTRWRFMGKPRSTRPFVPLDLQTRRNPCNFAGTRMERGWNEGDQNTKMASNHRIRRPFGGGFRRVSEKVGKPHSFQLSGFAAPVENSLLSVLRKTLLVSVGTPADHSTHCAIYLTLLGGLE